MASFSTVGLDDLINDNAALAAMPESVVDDMLNAKADVVERAQQKSAQTMLAGKYNTGALAKSIKRTPSKRKGSGLSLEIYPQGVRRDAKHPNGTRNAEIGFLNEFGTGSQPARPFIQTANIASGDEAHSRAEKVLDAFIKSKNL